MGGRGHGAQPREAGFRLEPLWTNASLGKQNKCFPLKNLRRKQDGKGTGMYSYCVLRPGAVFHQSSNHHTEDSRRAPFSGLLGVTAKTDRQTVRALSSPQQPGQAGAQGSAVGPLCTWRLVGRDRYLTRFSTEYTEM